MKTLEERVLEAIRRARMMPPGDRVGVAVSGGADSVALLRLLESLRDELGIALVVVHFDHCLRATESEDDARFTAELARARNLEFVCGREDVAAVAAQNKWNLEDAARRARYGFFDALVTEKRVNRVAVAHTADDQAETVLAHMLRGTGPTGLGGIYPSVGSIVRPLLSERRADLRSYLRELSQTWREDSTNQDTRRLRARIRSRLMPLLEQDFALEAVRRLVGLAELAREEEVFWRALVDDRFQAFVDRRNDNALAIPIRDLLSPLAFAGAAEAAVRPVTERLIRRLYEGVCGNRKGLTAEHVRQVIRLASESSSGRHVELPGGVIAERVFGSVIFAWPRERAKRGETGARSAAYQHMVTLPQHGTTTISVPELKRRFCLKVIDWSFVERDTKRENAAVLDADRLRAPLVLRNWRPGDAYRARGRRQSQKLKQMFLAQRVPTRDRASWPVLESAGRVAWAFGMPPAEDFCVNEGTRAGVVIEEERF